jgi:hypothetical protein
LESVTEIEKLLESWPVELHEEGVVGIDEIDEFSNDSSGVVEIDMGDLKRLTGWQVK